MPFLKVLINDQMYHPVNAMPININVIGIKCAGAIIIVVRTSFSMVALVTDSFGVANDGQDHDDADHHKVGGKSQPSPIFCTKTVDRLKEKKVKFQREITSKSGMILYRRIIFTSFRVESNMVINAFKHLSIFLKQYCRYNLAE